MTSCGIARIDQLLEEPEPPPIGSGDPDRGAVSVIQDFLISHGCHGLESQAGLLGPNRGVFGPVTIQCVRTFQSDQGLSSTGSVDRATLQALIAAPTSDP